MVKMDDGLIYSSMPNGSRFCPLCSSPVPFVTRQQDVDVCGIPLPSILFAAPSFPGEAEVDRWRWWKRCCSSNLLMRHNFFNFVRSTGHHMHPCPSSMYHLIGLGLLFSLTSRADSSNLFHDIMPLRAFCHGTNGSKVSLLARRPCPSKNTSRLRICIESVRGVPGKTLPAPFRHPMRKQNKRWSGVSALPEILSEHW